MGGGLSLAYAAKFPDQIKRLMICDASGLPLQRSLLQWIKAYMDMHNQASNLPDEVRSKAPGYTSMIKEMIKNPLGVYKAWRISAQENLESVLSSVIAPTKILWGSEDHFIPIDIGKRMAKMLPNATFNTVPNPSHFWYYLEPKIFAEQVLATLAEESN